MEEFGHQHPLQRASLWTIKLANMQMHELPLRKTLLELVNRPRLQAQQPSMDGAVGLLLAIKP